MHEFGIEGYRPRWLRTPEAVLDAHGDRLAALVGRRLTSSWIVWDLSCDEWFADCPVVFDFDGEQVEINHTELDEVSVTWNSIDTGRHPFWVCFDDFQPRLRWRSDAIPALAALAGRLLDAVELLEYQGDDVANGALELGFLLGGTRVGVYNALDENGLGFDTPLSHYRRHPLG
ncbi:hypothetical protein [Saccharomonospora cyanea]|nr:hypothetical protein [Saccharomonospora cyanea]